MYFTRKLSFILLVTATYSLIWYLAYRSFESILSATFILPERTMFTNIVPVFGISLILAGFSLAIRPRNSWWPDYFASIAFENGIVGAVNTIIIIALHIDGVVKNQFTAWLFSGIAAIIIIAAIVIISRDNLPQTPHRDG